MRRARLAVGLLWLFPFLGGSVAHSRYESIPGTRLIWKTPSCEFVYAFPDGGSVPYSEDKVRPYVCDYLRTKDADSQKAFFEMSLPEQEEHLRKGVAEADAAFQRYQEDKRSVLSDTEVSGPEEPVEALREKHKKLQEAIRTIARDFKVNEYPYVQPLRDREHEFVKQTSKRADDALKAKRADKSTQVGRLDNTGGRLGRTKDGKAEVLDETFSGAHGRNDAGGRSASRSQTQLAGSSMAGGALRSPGTSIKVDGNMLPDGDFLSEGEKGRIRSRHLAVEQGLSGHVNIATDKDFGKSPDEMKQANEAARDQLIERGLSERRRSWYQGCSGVKIGESCEVTDPALKAYNEAGERSAERAWQHQQRADGLRKEHDQKAAEAEWKGDHGQATWERTKGDAGYLYEQGLSSADDFASKMTGSGATWRQAEGGDRKAQVLILKEVAKGGAEIALVGPASKIAGSAVAETVEVVETNLGTKVISKASQALGNGMSLYEKVHEVANPGLRTITKGLSGLAEEVSATFESNAAKPVENLATKAAGKASKRVLNDTLGASGDSGEQLEPQARVYLLGEVAQR